MFQFTIENPEKTLKISFRSWLINDIIHYFFDAYLHGFRYSTKNSTEYLIGYIIRY